MVLRPGGELAVAKTVQLASHRGLVQADAERLVHHATIFEMNVESYRRRVALERKRGPGRPPTRATVKTLAD